MHIATMAAMRRARTLPRVVNAVTRVQSRWPLSSEYIGLKLPGIGRRRLRPVRIDPISGVRSSSAPSPSRSYDSSSAFRGLLVTCIAYGLRGLPCRGDRLRWLVADHDDLVALGNGESLSKSEVWPPRPYRPMW